MIYREKFHTPDPSQPGTIPATLQESDIAAMMDRFGYPDEIRQVIQDENLLPTGLLSRIQATYPEISGLAETGPFLFHGKQQYSGLEGFREVVSVLSFAGIDIGHIDERELFIEVYSFLATRHALNGINWENFANNSMFQLVFPQPGMIDSEVVEAYLAASSPMERTEIACRYREKTNPHDGNQLLNKPWFVNDEGEMEILEGSQHKYPQCQLIFDKTTQNCFAFCTYCFRHAQLHGDEDMFLQRDVAQVHAYLRQHKEVTDLLVTGGDAGYMSAGRFAQYALPIISDPELLHIRTIRFASRMLSYHPEMILSPRYDEMLKIFKMLNDNGIQLAWMSHFSTPRELLNPSTIAAIRRLQKYGVVLRSQSPIMKHISMFEDENGNIDVERSSRNWIDLANLLATMGISFHSMYCARPTGEQSYFAAPLTVVNEVASRVHRSLASINRPSRYVSMTTSAGKISILGTTKVGDEMALALKFTEGRNMEWMDRVFLAKYDQEQNTVDLLEPFDTEEFFFQDELKEIEAQLQAVLLGKTIKL